VAKPDGMGRGRFASQLNQEAIGNGGRDGTNTYECQGQKSHGNLNDKSTNRLNHYTGNYLVNPSGRERLHGVGSLM
jgi:hypothetical protein